MTTVNTLEAVVSLNTANALGGINQIQKGIAALKADLFSMSGSLDKAVAGLRKLNSAGSGTATGSRAASGSVFGGASPAAVYAQTKAQSEATARAQIAANARIEAERLKNDRAVTQAAARTMMQRQQLAQRAGIVEAQTQRAVLQTQREGVRLEQDRSRAKLASISLAQREAQVQQKTLADRMKAIGPIKGPFSGPQQQMNDNPMPLSLTQRLGMAARRLLPGLGGAAGLSMTGRTPLPQANPLWFLQRDAYFNQRRQQQADATTPSLLGRIASALNPLNAVRGLANVASRLNPMNLLPQRQSGGGSGGGPSLGLMAGASFIGNMGTQIAMAVGGAIKNQIGGVFDAIAENERLNTSFQTLVGRELLRTGQAKTPQQALEMAVPETKRLRTQFTLPTAIQSPFGEEDVASVYQRLLTVGLPMDKGQKYNAENITRGLVDLAAGYRMNGDEMNRLAKALGDVKSRGYLTGEEVRQFVNARFDVQGAVADVLKVSREEVAKLQKEKKISADTVLEAFMRTVNEEPIKGAAKRTAESWGGLAETFQDIGRVVRRELGGPAFEALRPPVIAFSNFLQDQIYSGKLTELGERIGRSVQAGMGLAQRVVGQIQSAGAPALDRIVKSYQRFQDLRKQGLNRTAVSMTLKDLGIPDDLATTVAIWADRGEQALKGAWRRVSSAATAFQQSRAGGATVGKAGEAFLTALGMPSDLANVAGKWADGAAGAVGEAFRRVRAATVVWDQGGRTTDVLQALGLPAGAADMLGGWAEGAARAVGGALGKVKDAVVTAANGGTSVDVMVALGLPKDAATQIDTWGTTTAQAVGTAFGRITDAANTAQAGGSRVSVLEKLGLSETDSSVVDRWLKNITTFFEEEGRKQDEALRRASLSPIFTGALSADFDNKTFLQKIDEMAGKVGGFVQKVEDVWTSIRKLDQTITANMPAWLRPFNQLNGEAHPLWEKLGMGPDANRPANERPPDFGAAQFETARFQAGLIAGLGNQPTANLPAPPPAVLFRDVAPNQRPPDYGAAQFETARFQAQGMANLANGAPEMDLPSRQEIVTAIADRVAPQVTPAASGGMQSPDRMDAKNATGAAAQVPVNLALTPEPTAVQEAISGITEKLTGAKTTATDTAPVFGELGDRTRIVGESAAGATPSVDALGVSIGSPNVLAGKSNIEQYGGAVGGVGPLADAATVSTDAFGVSVNSPNFSAGLASLSGYTSVLGAIPGLADSAAASMQRLNQAADQFETPEGLQRHSPSEMEQSLSGTAREANRAGAALGHMPIASMAREVERGVAEWEDFGLTLDDVKRGAKKPVEPVGITPPVRDQYYKEPAFRAAKPGGATQTGPARLLPNAPGTTSATGKAQAQAQAEAKKPEPLKPNYQIEYEKRIQSGFERIGGLQSQLQSGDMGTVLDKYLFRIGVNRDEQVRVGNNVRSAIDSARDANGRIPNLEEAIKAFGTPEGDSLADEVERFLRTIGVKEEQLNATVESIRRAETGMKNDLRGTSIQDTVGKLLDEPRYANEKDPEARRKAIEDLVQSLIDRPTPEDAKGLNLPTLDNARLQLDRYGRPLPLRPEAAAAEAGADKPVQVDRYGRPILPDSRNMMYSRDRTPGMDAAQDFLQGNNAPYRDRTNSRTPGLDAARAGNSDYALPQRNASAEGAMPTGECKCAGGANINLTISVSADADPNSVARKVAPLIVEELRLQGIRP